MMQLTEEQRKALIERLNHIAEKLKWHNAAYAQDVLQAVDALSAPPVAALRLPDGWKLVPVEPSWEMVSAAIKSHEGDAFLPVSLYKSMLAAAPSPSDDL